MRTAEFRAHLKKWAPTRLQSGEQNYLKQKVCALSPDTVLGLGTANGARALGWELGHLERGELADLILVDRRSPHLCPLISAPRSNVAFNLVYYATGADVDTVIIDGKIVFKKD